MFFVSLQWLARDEVKSAYAFCFKMHAAFSHPPSRPEWRDSRPAANHKSPVARLFVASQHRFLFPSASRRSTLSSGGPNRLSVEEISP
ncbi:MAG: hypothetical protein ACLPJJ_02345 [Acidocella sp.]|uniref:hypothetical protein n=1 Tax=Acidocella sp. TaxID=50710 RepID=UPI003FD70614